MAQRFFLLKDLNIAHLTGTATIHKNSLYSDTVEFNRPCRSIGQMFFKPYESKKEFIFCARHTCFPLLFAVNPLTIAVVASVCSGMALGALLISGVYYGMNNQASASFWLTVSEAIFADLCQNMIDMMVLPVAVLMFASRGLSTGLKVAGVYDYDARHDKTQHDHASQPSFGSC